MQSQWDMPMTRKDNNLLDNFRPYIDEKLALEVPDIEEDDINLVSKSLDTTYYQNV